MRSRQGSLSLRKAPDKRVVRLGVAIIGTGDLPPAAAEEGLRSRVLDKASRVSWHAV